MRKLRRGALSLRLCSRGASDKLNAYPKSALGLTPDHIKATAQWQAERKACDLAFNALRNYNRSFTKAYAHELRAERKAKRVTA